MYSKNGELFLLGAGASAEHPYYLPTWNELKDKILKKPTPGVSEENIEKVRGWLNDPESEDKTIDEIMEDKYNKGHNISVFSRIFIPLLHVMSPFHDQHFLYRIFDYDVYSQNDLMEIFSNKFFITFNYDGILNIVIKQLLIDRYMSLIDIKKFKTMTISYGNGSEVTSSFTKEFAEIWPIIMENNIFQPHGCIYFMDGVHPENIETPVSSKMSITPIGLTEKNKGCYKKINDRILSGKIQATHLYVLGVGEGLESNLNKINLERMNIQNIQYTCYGIYDKPEDCQRRNENYINYFKSRMPNATISPALNTCSDFASLYRRSLMFTRQRYLQMKNIKNDLSM